MKKFFSLIALVGLFAACEPEQIMTAFEVDDAVATINVKVVDVLTGDDVTSVATITASKGTVANGVVTVTGDPAIQAQDITVTATYNGSTASMPVPVNYILAGGKAEYAVTLVVGTPVDGYEFECGQAAAGQKVVITSYLGTADHNYSHAGLEKWVMNPTEFMLKGVVTYDSLVGQAVEDLEAVAGFENVVNALAEAYHQGVTQSKKAFEIKVSAYSWYTAYSQISITAYPFAVKAVKDGKSEVVGTFNVVLYGTTANYKEIAIPAGYHGHGHYVQGHGHAHADGSYPNAGGGIVIGE